MEAENCTILMSYSSITNLKEIIYGIMKDSSETASLCHKVILHNFFNKSLYIGQTYIIIVVIVMKQEFADK